MPGKPLPTIGAVLKRASILLRPKKITCAEDKDLGHLEAELLLSSVLGMDRVALVTHADKRVSAKYLRTFDVHVRRRLKHEPVAQIVGHKGFYGREFSITKNVLIPRPETELLIEQALEAALTKTVFWDVGTGSGAIAVTLAAERPNASVLATDISTHALAVAHTNAKTHKVAKRIRFLRSDLLQPEAYRWLKKEAKTHDTLIICANLPYLPDSDKKILDPDVVKFEPASALFSGNDGLKLIRRFLGQLSRHLPEWGYKKTTILMEFDPPQAVVLESLASSLFPTSTIVVHKDLAQRDRLLEITL